MIRPNTKFIIAKGSTLYYFMFVIHIICIVFNIKGLYIKRFSAFKQIRSNIQKKKLINRAQGTGIVWKTIVSHRGNITKYNIES